WEKIPRQVFRVMRRREGTRRTLIRTHAPMAMTWKRGGFHDGGRRSGGVTAARRTRLGGKWPHPVPCAARCDNRQAAPRGGRAHRGAAAASAARAAPALRASTLALRRRRGERHGE